ncbi:MAG TPA: hypothetical protein VF173_12970 [Thermoanaerobaculia bacterium]|nr:hypothetical protein [Thermoanaerobaculia bacterium]
MNEETFRPCLREDGTVDPDSLKPAGQPWVTTWLKGRFSGDDPYFPLDKRGGEAPSSLIVEILEDAGTAHRSTGLIGEGILDLLDEARQRAPEIPPYLKPALQVCQRASLPGTSTWFTEELQDLAAAPESVEERWGTQLVKEILHGAIRQSPGLGRAASYASWRMILNVPRYATLAWMGLAQSFAASLNYMEDWWKACPVTQRQAEIDQFVFTGLRTEGREQVRALLSPRSRSWPAALKSAVDAALKNNGIPEVFGSQGKGKLNAHQSAILGAARRREIVLLEQQQEQAA